MQQHKHITRYLQSKGRYETSKVRHLPHETERLIFPASIDCSRKTGENITNNRKVVSFKTFKHSNSGRKIGEIDDRAHAKINAQDACDL